MLVIRKFVGYTGAAAGIGVAIALAMTLQPATAAAPIDRVDKPAINQFTPSADCIAAIKAIKNAVRADVAQDIAERQAVRLGLETVAEDVSEDAAERANLQGLFSAARTACAPSVTRATAAPFVKTFTPSGPCADAIHALKTAWAQSQHTTQAQWQNLQPLVQAVRSACGWTWKPER